MTAERRLQSAQEWPRTIVSLLALGCFAVWSGTSWARWAGFGYRTFDLAYYVQALWQLIHGRFQVSVQGVPLLGNHVEPIVFLIAPFFFVFRHPMLFVILQNAALATMGPVGYSMARRLGFEKAGALFLAAALLLAPATGYVALHEFHPEALTAPFLLLMLRARVFDSRRQHWLWFLATLACKENMALLLAAYGAVQVLFEHRRGFAYLRGWFIWPAVVALGWFVLCSQVITPAFNSGNIDYAALYERLGSGPREMLLNLFTHPVHIMKLLGNAVMQGNLVWGLFAPLLFLPLLRPKWMLMTAPVFLQHLLSWRSSEWTIYFHYAAPMLPLLWFAAVEAMTGIGHPRLGWLRRGLPLLLLGAALAGQLFWGPVFSMAETAQTWRHGGRERARKEAFIAAIPPQASVLAPLPYLSHLALREELHSLHYVLKGLKTLSREPFDPPPPTDYVVLDYRDTATFDAAAGYYHPAMHTAGDTVIPSSDRLLHQFLVRASWESEAADELTLLHRAEPTKPPPESGAEMVAQLDPQTKLLAVEKSQTHLATDGSFEVTLRWDFEGERTLFPWMALQLVNAERTQPIILMRGLCAPEVKGGRHSETWRVTAAAQIPPGTYQVEAVFFDNTKRAWTETHGPSGQPTALLLPPVSLGNLEVIRGTQSLP